MPHFVWPDCKAAMLMKTAILTLMYAQLRMQHSGEENYCWELNDQTSGEIPLLECLRLACRSLTSPTTEKKVELRINDQWQPIHHGLTTPYACTNLATFLKSIRNSLHNQQGDGLQYVRCHQTIHVKRSSRNIDQDLV